MSDKKPVHQLELRDFMKYYDPGDPYHNSAISQLQAAIPKELLRSDSLWFNTWSQSGIRADPYYQNSIPEYFWPYKENPFD